MKTIFKKFLLLPHPLVFNWVRKPNQFSLYS